jgi:hypothetical protein
LNFLAADYQFQKVEQEKLLTAKTKLPPTTRKTTADSSSSDSEDENSG